MNTFTPSLVRRAAWLLGASAALMSLSACVVVPAHHGAYGRPAPVYGEVVVAPVAPPPPQVEVVPAVPFAGAVWIGGYWNWAAGRHVWVPGRWEAPRAGYRYEPHRWAPHANGWSLEGGWRVH